MTDSKYNKDLFSFQVEQRQLLTPEEWLQIKNIFARLKVKINLNEISQKNQQILWYTLKYFQREINKIIRQYLFRLFKLCCKLGNKNKIKQLAHRLFKIKSIMRPEKCNSVLSSYRGLKVFLKKIKNTVGSIEVFLSELEIFQNLEQFMKNKRDYMLIDEYKYIKNITLPISGYEKLRENLSNLLKQFQKLEGIVYNRSKRREFLTDLQKFKNIYILHYHREHERYQQKLKYFYQKLKKLPEYRFLRKKMFTGGDNKVLTYLNNFFPAPCQNRKLSLLLKRQPSCHCGFSLKNDQYLPEIEKVIPLLKKEINKINQKGDKYEKID